MRSRALQNRMFLGVGQETGTVRIRLTRSVKHAMRVSIAALASAASPETSASNRHLTTICRVSRIMSSWRSRV